MFIGWKGEQMKFLLEMVDWVIRTKAQGEQFDNSKSAEKFKWFSVILEFIQNAIDSNLLFNRLKKKIIQIIKTSL